MASVWTLAEKLGPWAFLYAISGDKSRSYYWRDTCYRKRPPSPISTRSNANAVPRTANARRIDSASFTDFPCLYGAHFSAYQKIMPESDRRRPDRRGKFPFITKCEKYEHVRFAEENHCWLVLSPGLPAGCRRRKIAPSISVVAQQLTAWAKL